MEPLRESGAKTSYVVKPLNLVDRELELELAQTKLALVETECKNQDLTHQFTVTQVSTYNPSAIN